MASQIDYHRFSRGESCTEEGCRSGKWYIEDGKKFCQRGHEQAGFTQTQQDEDDWNNQGRKVRKKREEKERVQAILSGREAKELYLQCYQLVLWKQCHWLVNVKDFPPELETVVRDLWGLRLRIFHDDSGKQRERFGSGVSVAGYSDTSEGETGSDAADGRSLWSVRSRSSTAGRKESLPVLIETLALCYLGTLLLNLPTSLGEIFKWASQGDMVYTRAINEIPKAMRAKLPAHFHSALEIHTPLKGSAIYSAVMKLVNFYHLHLEMAFPALNSPLLLIKHVEDLGLSIEIYPAVRKLASLLDFDFKYPTSQKRDHRLTAHPEIRLMSLIVVATKLSQPFDSITRYPESESDPSIVQNDWSQWAHTMSKPPEEDFRKGQEIHVKDKDVFGMTKKQIDDYLDTYQHTWIDDRRPKIAEHVLELFPLPGVPERSTEDSDREKKADNFKEVQRSSALRRPEPVKEDGDDVFARPGEYYRRFRTFDELTKESRAFYEVAAKNTGVEITKLVRAVFWTEIQLENWSLAERKRRLAEITHDFHVT